MISNTIIQTRFFIFVLMLVAGLSLSAQELTVKSMEQVSDATASMFEYQLADNNGDYAGIVKVLLALDGAQFDGGGVLKQQKIAVGEYWVWMAKNSSRLTVRVQGYIPLELNFREYEGVNVIHSKTTYKLVLSVPNLVSQPQDDGLSYLIVKVNPSNALVIVDDSIQKQSENGEVRYLLPRGSHTYSVTANNCASQQGTVTIGREKKTIEVKLVSKMAQLKVECPTVGAQVYVNEQLKGSVPWNGSLGADTYRIELRHEGYRSQTQTVRLSENSTRTVSFPALTALTGSLNVNYEPTDCDVYVDGKKVGTSPDIFRNIVIGHHRVELRKEGYKAVFHDVEVKENKTSELTGSLTALVGQRTNSILYQPTTERVGDSIMVRGHVKTDDGQDAIGASVLVKGKGGYGYITDLKGKFKCRVIQGDVLVVRLIGYEPQEVIASKEIEVTLRELSKKEWKELKKSSKSASKQ